MGADVEVSCRHPSRFRFERDHLRESPEGAGDFLPNLAAQEVHIRHLIEEAEGRDRLGGGLGMYVEEGKVRMVNRLTGVPLQRSL